MTAIILSVLLMAAGPKSEGRILTNTQEIKYEETVSLEHKINFDAKADGSAEIIFSRLKSDCLPAERAECWENFSEKKNMSDEQKTSIFKPIDEGKWRYFTSQIESKGGTDTFSLKVISDKGEISKGGNIFDAMANSSLGRFRNALLAMINGWFPKKGAAN